LPDQGFLEAIQAVVPLADGLALTQGGPSLKSLVQMRALFCDRVKRCNAWQWRRTEVGETMERHLAGAVRALFVHSPHWFAGPTDSRLPEDAVSFATIFPALADLAVDAPGLEYVATLMMNDFDRGAAWAPAENLIAVAEAWLTVRGGDTVFWRDHGFGQRLCKWLERRLARTPRLSADLADRVLALADRLAKIGVPEALSLESAVAVV
jgi:hypothetical protein